jgi:hypothetical protein
VTFWTTAPWIALVAVLLAAAPDASACPYCMSGTDETRNAYYATTALLAVLPFAVVGALALWVRSRLRGPS